MVELGENFSFHDFCRSKMATEVLWEKVPYQLTYPWTIKNDENPFGVPLGTMQSMAVAGRVTWNGKKPPTIQDRINKISGEKRMDDGMASRHFRNPALLEVEFTPAKSCDKSLDDLVQFSANKWVFEECKDDSTKCIERQQGEQAYMLRAVVRHRKDPVGSDSIRVLGRDGREVMPPAAVSIG